MPTRTQTPKRPAAGRFARSAQPPARGRRAPSSGRPALPSMGSRRKPAKPGAAKAADRFAGLMPGTRGQKRGGSDGPGKKGAAGLALLAGAAGLLMKNREKLTSMIRHRDTSAGSVAQVERPEASAARNSGPVDPAAVNALASPDHHQPS